MPSPLNQTNWIYTYPTKIFKYPVRLGELFWFFEVSIVRYDYLYNARFGLCYHYL